MSENLSNIEVLVLVGGLGNRLRSVVSDVPKPMVRVDNKPFVEYLVKYLSNLGFKKICFLTGHLSEKVSDYFGDGSKMGLSIRYSVEDFPLGTGGCVKMAIGTSQFEEYLILNGDTFFAINPTEIFQSKEILSMALCHVDDISRYGEVILSKNVVSEFREKQALKHAGYINSGMYYTDRKILDYMPVGESFSLEKDVFPGLVKKHEIAGHIFKAPFLDIGIPEDFYKAESLIKEMRLY
jgi:D-glycero-alpha-D-manno-heptose 1-phosphate guanylyltransferase